MGIYMLSPDEIADVFERHSIEMECEGDFDEETFIKGAKEYLKRLRKQGAYIPKR